MTRTVSKLFAVEHHPRLDHQLEGKRRDVAYHNKVFCDSP